MPGLRGKGREAVVLVNAGCDTVTVPWLPVSPLITSMWPKVHPLQLLRSTSSFQPTPSRGTRFHNLRCCPNGHVGDMLEGSCSGTNHPSHRGRRGTRHAPPQQHLASRFPAF